jgi:predicted site-specific integrase-resolvase
MKAKEIMKKYNITRNTLSNWVKKGYIKVDKTLSGRYIYIDKDEKNEKDNVS